MSASEKIREILNLPQYKYIYSQSFKRLEGFSRNNRSYEIKCRKKDLSIKSKNFIKNLEKPNKKIIVFTKGEGHPIFFFNGFEATDYTIFPIRALFPKETDLLVRSKMTNDFCRFLKNMII
jgi:hypothetical protein